MNTYKNIKQLFDGQWANCAAAACGLLCSIATSALPSASDAYVLQSLPGSAGVHASAGSSASSSLRSSSSSSSLQRVSLRRQRYLLRLQKSAQQHAAAPLHRAAPVVTRKTVVAMAETDPPAIQPQAPASSASSESSLAVPAPVPAASPRPAEPVPAPEAFPPFLHASFPVAQAPNWGNMHTPQLWNRTYSQMTPADYVRIPSYDLGTLTTPMASLTDPLLDQNIPAITAKLFYSTRFFGAYDLDSGEFVSTHAGVDLKLPLGTPLGAVAGGRVLSVSTDDVFGLHVIIEHRHPTDGTFYSIYGHLGSATVQAGEAVVPGQTIGRVGMTGNTTGPHLHWQIDRGQPGESAHQIYVPASVPSRAEADLHVINPVTFVARYRS
jgi:murein DD-endopeptidase MepM/ murein hydrolase activator NlpD